MTFKTDRRVLVVEDEPLIRMLVADMLVMQGFVVLEAATGGEALALAAERLDELYALMIDLGLPDRPGEAVIAELLARRPALPVVVSTGDDARAVTERLRGRRIHVLQKPYQYEDLERAMANLAQVQAQAEAERASHPCD